MGHCIITETVVDGDEIVIAEWVPGVNDQYGSQVTFIPKRVFDGIVNEFFVVREQSAVNEMEYREWRQVMAKLKERFNK